MAHIYRAFSVPGTSVKMRTLSGPPPKARVYASVGARCGAVRCEVAPRVLTRWAGGSGPPVDALDGFCSSGNMSLEVEQPPQGEGPWRAGSTCWPRVGLGVWKEAWRTLPRSAAAPSEVRDRTRFPRRFAVGCGGKPRPRPCGVSGPITEKSAPPGVTQAERREVRLLDKREKVLRPPLVWMENCWGPHGSYEFSYLEGPA